MRKTRVSAVLLLISLLSTGPFPAASAAEPAGGETVSGSGEAALTEQASLGNFVLYADEATAEFAVRDSASGKVWYSVPQNLAGSGLTEEEQNRVRSAVTVSCFNKSGEEKVLGSWDEAAAKGQVSVSSISNGVRVLYTLGRDEDSSLLPAAITEERMNELVLGPLGENRKSRRVSTLYRLLDKAEVPAGEWDALVREYPVLSKQSIYVLREVEEREREELEEIFRSVGYTAKMRKQDNQITGETHSAASTPLFKIPLEIVLTENGVSVSVDADAIEYNRDFYLHKITLLPYFAAGRLGEDGFLLYPDGSGSRIPFPDSETAAVISGVTKATYGNNYALQPVQKSTKEQPVRLPVFGLQSGGQSFLAVIRQGDAIAELTYEVSGASRLFNRVFASFILGYKDEMAFDDWGGSGYSWTAYAKEPYTGKTVLEYCLLSGENIGLGGMADACRRALLGDKERLPESDISFYLETLGVFRRPDKIIGFSVNRKTSLTTFEEAAEMLGDLSGAGVRGLRLKYTGWANNGLENTAYSVVKPESKLGGTGGLKLLAESLKAQNIPFFPDLELLYVSKNGWFDGFSPNADAVKRLDKKLGGQIQLRLSDGKVNSDVFRYTVSPDVSLRFAKKNSASLDGMGLVAVSAASIGQDVSANFSASRSVGRQQAADAFSRIAAVYTDGGKAFMTAGGNAYMLPYATDIVSLPETSSEYSLSQHSVPFLQMVLHGYTDYAGDPLNLSDDYHEALLRAALCGSGVYFLLNKNNTQYLRETQYAGYYATDYKAWTDTAAEAYQRLNAVLKEVRTAGMSDFRVLADGVYQVVYSNGKSVAVNFGSADYENNGYAVKARDFVLWPNQ